MNKLTIMDSEPSSPSRQYYVYERFDCVGAAEYVDVGMVGTPYGVVHYTTTKYPYTGNEIELFYYHVKSGITYSRYYTSVNKGLPDPAKAKEYAFEYAEEMYNQSLPLVDHKEKVSTKKGENNE